MTQLPFRSATDLAAAIRRKDISGSELLECYLDRIERLNPGLNAVVTLDPDRARREAREADRRTAHGDPAGPLHGLPMTVKDSIETAGMRTTVIVLSGVAFIGVMPCAASMGIVSSTRSPSTCITMPVTEDMFSTGRTPVMSFGFTLLVCSGKPFGVGWPKASCGVLPQASEAACAPAAGGSFIEVPSGATGFC